MVSVNSINLFSSVNELAEPKTPFKLCFKAVSLLALVFLIVLAASLAHHFLFAHTKVTFAFDGKHYLSTCQQITNLILSLIHGHPQMSLLWAKTFQDQILLDGPIVTSIPAFLFIFIGRQPEISDWRILNVLYSTIHATSAVLCSVIAFKLCRNWSFAVAAGLIFGFYPPTFTATARYCSEVPAVCFTLLFLLALTYACNRKWLAFVAGMLATMVVLTKSALLPTVCVAILMSLLHAPRNKRLFLFLSIIGMASCTMLPWSAYVKSITGKISVVTERNSSYNAAIGTDRETDAWCTVPDSPYCLIMKEMDSPLSILVSQWYEHPQELVMLLGRKLVRLFAEPWNDFRHHVFGLPIIAQRLLHISVIVIGFAGMVVYSSKRRALKNLDTKLLADLCILFVAGHVAFAIFQAMGRYAFVSMPLFTIFAVYGLFLILSSAKNRLQFKKGIVFIVVLSLVVGTVAVWTSSIKFNGLEEIPIVMNSGDLIEKRIDLSYTHFPAQPETVLIGIDAKEDLPNMEIFVNGRELSGKFRCLRHFDAQNYYLSDTMREHSGLMGLAGIKELRQWRVVPVPAAWIHTSGPNTICLVNKGERAVVYADVLPFSRKMLSPKYFASDVMLVSMDSLDPRVTSPIKTANIKERSLFKRFGGEMIPLKNALRVKLIALPGRRTLAAKKEDGRCPVYKQEFCANLYAADFEPLLRDADHRCIRVNKGIVKWAHSTSANVTLPTLASSTHIQLNLSGCFRLLNGHGSISLLIRLFGPKGNTLIVGNSPNFIPGSARWQNFSIEDLIPRQCIAGQIESVSVAVFPCPSQETQYGVDKSYADAQFTDLKLSVKAVNQPEITCDRALYY